MIDPRPRAAFFSSLLTKAAPAARTSSTTGAVSISPTRAIGLTYGLKRHSKGASSSAACLRTKRSCRRFGRASSPVPAPMVLAGSGKMFWRTAYRAVCEHSRFEPSEGSRATQLPAILDSQSVRMADQKSSGAGVRASGWTSSGGCLTTSWACRSLNIAGLR